VTLAYTIALWMARKAEAVEPRESDLKEPKVCTLEVRRRPELSKLLALGGRTVSLGRGFGSAALSPSHLRPSAPPTMGGRSLSGGDHFTPPCIRIIGALGLGAGCAMCQVGAIVSAPSSLFNLRPLLARPFLCGLAEPDNSQHDGYHQQRQQQVIQ
jgi:hypothetical protein